MRTRYQHDSTGWGLFLQEFSEVDHGWEWHCLYTVRLCEAHFLRSINRAVPDAEHTEYSVWGRMKALLYCKSPDEYYAHIRLLQGIKLLSIAYTTRSHDIAENESKAVADWAAHKAHFVIAGGLVKCNNYMEQRVWDSLERTSNAAEQAGMKSYRNGINKTLLEAILM